MNLKPILIFGLAITLSSCGILGGKGGFGKKKSASKTTGWAYDDPDNGGFQSDKDYKPFTGPGLVFIEGGTFTMGRATEDVMYDWNNVPRRVTVASFYMDETEVANIDYREYLYWLKRVYPEHPEKYKEALPDTLVWREKLGYNEPYVSNYLRHPAYSNYPVVGVSWIQATEYCKWRTSRVNEQILIDKGILSHDNNQSGENIFTTKSYLSGLYEGTQGDKPVTDASGNARRTQWEDGILLPNYRLPTEAEWEYAAYGLMGNTKDGVMTDRKIYPWNGTYMRDDSKKNRGRIMANFTRGKGDLMGMAGDLNDNADITAPVDSYSPNDFGLYCMAGNVNEWVADVYRPMNSQEMNEFQPFRGSVFTNYKKDENGKFIKNEYGELEVDTIQDSRNYKDGDYQNQVIEGQDWNAVKNKTTGDMYTQKKGEYNSLINDHVRVYKGGSWKDRAYWLNPGTRRYKEQTASADDLGFRCAMTRVGSPGGFKMKKK